MARRIAISSLNARTVDILNTIRANASAAYQDSVPAITKATEIPKVGEAVVGYPARANEFINALVNRIAFVNIKSLDFNNAYADLKKGYLEYGETVEEAFVQIAKARVFSAEKAADRELKRSLPDVRAAFHLINWKVQYPVTIERQELELAFLTPEGVTDMIARITGSVLQGAEYDEFLLFKYLMIKSIANGKMYPIAFDSSNMSTAAKTFRGTSNKIIFPSTDYNAAGVLTSSPREDQYIFMDAQFNADYDVDVLAAAFNMDKAEFMGHLKLIDDWTTFDNERFEEIQEESDMLEPLTAEELALMANVKAVVVDKEFFQIYDKLSMMTETPVNSGLYWNYFYNVWKIVSASPFSNAIVFVDDAATITAPSSFNLHIDSVEESDEAMILTFSVLTSDGNPTLADTNAQFIQTETMIEDGVAMHRYGAMIVPTAKVGTAYTISITVNGVQYNSATAVTPNTAEVDTTITLNKAGS